LWEVHVFLFPPRFLFVDFFFVDFERAALGLDDLLDDALADALDAGLILWGAVYVSISFI
jgi:hypothetical protein